MNNRKKMYVGWGAGLTGPNCSFSVNLDNKLINQWIPLAIGDRMVAIIPLLEPLSGNDADDLVASYNEHDGLKAKAELLDMFVKFCNEETDLPIEKCNLDMCREIDELILRAKELSK